MNKNKRKKSIIGFIIAFIIIFSCLLASVVRVRLYNKKQHIESFVGYEFLNKEVVRNNIGLSVIPRTSTWGKIFDFNNEGLTDNNYQAYTYDFTIFNNSKDRINDFHFKLQFNQESYISQGWNGAIEIHQLRDDNEYVATVPDLRDFNTNDYNFDIFRVDGEELVVMKPGDYLVYWPSSTLNAKEIPIEANEATTPGIIMYFPMNVEVENLSFSLYYRMHRMLATDVFFIISFLALIIWILVLIINIITTQKIKKYMIQHERDNKIINESIETFTGFIDAKDPYTNGHSKRVAIYTRMIAKELGFEGDELDRFYYIALLHDCGKIGVPDNILDKPSKLTDEEFEIVKAHTLMGGEILKRFKSLKDVELGALFHHERYDGGGYPVGLVGEEIPLIARIICVADAYDAMNTNRIYRNKLDRETIISEIEKNKGLQFDPKIADVMLGLIKSRKVDLVDTEK